MKAVIDDKIPYIRGLIETLVEEVIYKAGSDIYATDVRDADILIVRTRTRCDRNLLSGSRVRLVVTATIGFDHIDTAYMEEAGIRWTNCPGCNASSVRQYVHNSLVATGWLRKGLTVVADSMCFVATHLRGSLPHWRKSRLKPISSRFTHRSPARETAPHGILPTTASSKVSVASHLSSIPAVGRWWTTGLSSVLSMKGSWQMP